MFAGLLAQAGAQGIFTCVDAKGRRLTADRPILECIDREQKEINPGGTVRRTIGPSLTAAERAAEEEKARKEAEERNRLAEEKRRDRALLTRYPDQATHDRERAAALAQAEEVIASANRRTGQLLAQRKSLDTEMEFFKQDPSRTPARLKRQLEENQQHLEAQARFLVGRVEEKQRVNSRFDEELLKLKQLWAERSAPANAAALPAPVKP